MFEITIKNQQRHRDNGEVNSIQGIVHSEKDKIIMEKNNKKTREI